MKKLVIAAGCLALTVGFVGCGGASGNDTGESYMPDMYYARAYEAYGYNNVEGERDSLTKRGIRYSGLPVPGTVARGDVGSYYLTNDTAGLIAAATLRNPLDTVAATPASLKEGERLYLVNCGICHGDKLDGNGPLYNNGNGPYPAAPKALNAADTKAMTDGYYFHVISFGKGSMGGYAGQLRPEQRWAVIKYIRAKQGGGAKATSDSTSLAMPDSASNANPLTTTPLPVNQQTTSKKPAGN
ncbi:MAG: c-type cytochrome [Bacteroidota bacterium]